MSAPLNASPDSRTLPPTRAGRVTAGLWLLAGVGAGTFLVGIAGPHAQRVWQAYLVNWLFWSGLALSGLMFTALLQLTKAEWAGRLREPAEALAGFLPVSLLSFVPLVWGSEHLFSWLAQPIPAKAAWLDKPFLFTRDLAGLVVLYGVGRGLLGASLQVRGRTVARAGAAHPATMFAFLTAGGRGASAGAERRLTVLSTLFILLYAVVFSLLAFDLVMALDPHWISTLFGAYFCVGNLYAGLGLLAVLGWLLPTSAGPPGASHDLGKLIFGFCILWTYLFWCHYLPIWYANLPEETGFLIVRLHTPPWQDASRTVLLLNFLLPFPLLLLQWVKRTPRVLACVGAAVLAGMWLERCVLVVPSVWHETWLPLGWLELGVLAGFLALFALSFRAFVRTFPFSPPGQAGAS